MTQLQVFGIPMVLVQTQDRWYNKGFYLRQAAPWDKRRGGTAALSEAQFKVVDAFSEVNKSANDAGLNRWQRRELVKSVMRGKSFGGAPRKPRRAPASDAKVKAAIKAAQAIVARF